jgi:hypothetical protein
MKISISILTIVFLFTFSNSCTNENIKSKYYIISLQDSINNGLLNGSIIDTTLPPPPPPIPQFFKWYQNIVFIMDSTDIVYIYQTEERKEEDLDTNDTLIYEYDFPYYLGLRPEHLIAIESKSFLSFLRLNNDIFKLDTTNVKSAYIFYIASNKDTIQNEAFYQFVKHVTKSVNRENNIHYLVRKTTEEENVVIKNKRNKREYYPERINWTANFINGNSKPFTRDYDLLERKTAFLRRAKETYQVNSLKITPME